MQKDEIINVDDPLPLGVDAKDLVASVTRERKGPPAPLLRTTGGGRLREEYLDAFFKMEGASVHLGAGRPR